TRALPDNLASTLVPSVQDWVQAPLLRSVEFSQISDFISHLVRGHESASAIALVESCGMVLGGSASHSERWDYEKILTANVPLLIKSAAVQTLSMLCR